MIREALKNLILVPAMAASLAVIAAPSAQDQPTNVSDAEMTRKIRQQIMNRDVSMEAKNITIVTEEGKVVLRGEVPSDAEKALVQDIAKSVARDVKNEIKVRR